jgi:transcription antitermination factor NusG
MNTAQKNKKEWYALYVNVRHEKKIAQRMLEKSLDCYIPLVKKMSQWSDRKKLVETPLIPGYAFVNLGPEEMDKPRFVNGVVNFVRFNGKPAIVRAAEIEGLKYFVENGYGLEEASDDELKIGDRVEFRLADFKSFIAVVEEFVGENFALITFEGVAKNYKLKAAKKALKKKN